MASYKVILLFSSLVSVLVFVKGSVIRKKREGPEAIQSFILDKVADGFAILEHGAGYKGQQDHQFDFFGAKAGIDAKPNIGFGDTARNNENETKSRKKREAKEISQDVKTEEFQNIFKEMWGAIVDGGKKIVKKFGDMIDGQSNQDQQGQPQQQHQTY
ncbi:hypothetical protein PVAND_005668 [Polypedilum vanderplanki]|uniref:Uncharacterized protein n=1 Tax=Polypedilum vanderplanki TaxID=319348 RepID=A0A9J6C1A5_POLVA|nr:hypothetical protein PVAND_005668 [Polypedilum vanderplanki]